MLSFILYLIVGGIIGWLAGLILGKDIPGESLEILLLGLLGLGLAV